MLTVKSTVFYSTFKWVTSLAKSYADTAAIQQAANRKLSEYAKLTSDYVFQLFI